MASKIRFRRDTATNWNSVNPVLQQGEPGYDLTNEKLKIGDGTSTWSQLEYLTTSGNADRLVNGEWTVSLGTDGVLSAGTINFSGTLKTGSQSYYQFEELVTGEGEDTEYYSKLTLPNIPEIFGGENLSLVTWGSELAIKVRNPDDFFNDYTWSFRNDGTLIAPSAIAFGDGNWSNISQVNDNFVITTNTGAGNPYSWIFDGFGNLTLPGGAVINTYNNGGEDATYLWSAPGEVIAVRSMIAENVFGGGIDVKPDGSVDIIAQDGDGGVSWSFNVDGSLTLPAGGDIVDSTGNSVLGGELPVGTRIVVAPTSSKGSDGDQEGDVAFNNNYIYRCIADYEQTQTTLTSIVATGSPASYLTFYSPNTPPADMTGLTVSGPSGYTGTVTGASVDQGAGQWQVPVSPDVTQVTGVYTFGTQSDIWKRVAWSNDTTW